MDTTLIVSCDPHEVIMTGIRCMTYESEDRRGTFVLWAPAKDVVNHSTVQPASFFGGRHILIPIVLPYHLTRNVRLLITGSRPGCLLHVSIFDGMTPEISLIRAMNIVLDFSKVHTREKLAHGNYITSWDASEVSRC